MNITQKKIPISNSVSVEKIHTGDLAFGNKLQLICFPYAGTSANAYKNLAHYAPPFIDIIAVQLPGRGRYLGETPFDNIKPAVEAIAVSIKPYLNNNFAFFGHSMGALLSFETAHYLNSGHSLNPCHLIVSGCQHPAFVDNSPLYHRLPDAELINELRRLNGTPDELLNNHEMLNLMLPAIRADYQICETYKFTNSHKLKCPITVYGGYSDETETKDLHAWEDYSTGDFTLKMFKGDHFFIHSSQKEVTNHLFNELNRYVT